MINYVIPEGWKLDSSHSELRCTEVEDGKEVGKTVGVSFIKEGKVYFNDNPRSRKFNTIKEEIVYHLTVDELDTSEEIINRVEIFSDPELSNSIGWIDPESLADINGQEITVLTSEDSSTDNVSFPESDKIEEAEEAIQEVTQINDEPNKTEEAKEIKQPELVTKNFKIKAGDTVRVKYYERYWADKTPLPQWIPRSSFKVSRVLSESLVEISRNGKILGVLNESQLNGKV